MRSITIIGLAAGALAASSITPLGMLGHAFAGLGDGLEMSGGFSRMLQSGTNSSGGGDGGGNSMPRIAGCNASIPVDHIDDSNTCCKAPYALMGAAAACTTSTGSADVENAIKKLIFDGDKSSSNETATYLMLSNLCASPCWTNIVNNILMPYADRDLRQPGCANVGAALPRIIGLCDRDNRTSAFCYPILRKVEKTAQNFGEQGINVLDDSMASLDNIRGVCEGSCLRSYAEKQQKLLSKLQNVPASNMEGTEALGAFMSVASLNVLCTKDPADQGYCAVKNAANRPVPSPSPNQRMPGTAMLRALQSSPQSSPMGSAPSGPVPSGPGGPAPSGPAPSGGAMGPAPSGPAPSGGAMGPAPSGPAPSGGAMGPAPSGPAPSGGAMGPAPSGPAPSGGAMGPAPSGGAMGPAPSGGAMGPAPSGGTMGPAPSGGLSSPPQQSQGTRSTSKNVIDPEENPEQFCAFCSRSMLSSYIDFAQRGVEYQMMQLAATNCSNMDKMMSGGKRLLQTAMNGPSMVCDPAAMFRDTLSMLAYLGSLPDAFCGEHNGKTCGRLTMEAKNLFGSAVQQPGSNSTSAPRPSSSAYPSGVAPPNQDIGAVPLSLGQCSGLLQSIPTGNPTCSSECKQGLQTAVNVMGCCMRSFVTITAAGLAMSGSTSITMPVGTSVVTVPFPANGSILIDAAARACGVELPRCGVRNPPRVATRLTLNYNWVTANAERLEAFKTAFLKDFAAAINMALDRVSIVDIRQGSVIVITAINAETDSAASTAVAAAQALTSGTSGSFTPTSVIALAASDPTNAYTDASAGLAVSDVSSQYATPTPSSASTSLLATLVAVLCLLAAAVLY